MFTFKTENPTGAYRSFYPSSHYIKVKGKIVGQIEDRTWQIRIMVEKSSIMQDGNPNCTWSWVQLAKESTSLQDAKDWLKANYEKITTRYNLHKLEK